MTGAVQPLLAVLDATRDQLQDLTKLAQRKQEAVAQDDLMALDEIMNREQAAALALRGLDQKREQLLRDLGWEDVPLSGLAERCPAPVQAQAKAAAGLLETAFRRYRQEAQTAREAVERSLREVEHTLTGLGVPPRTEGAGYAGEEPARPAVTDFRA